jgi:hypothetical protein
MNKEKMNMNKKMMMSIAALAISGAFVSAGIAQQTAATTVQKPAVMQKASKSENWEKAQGVLEKVDEPTRVITVQTQQNKMMTFSVVEHTYITDVTTKVPLSALKKGMPVTVEYAKEGNIFQAKWIDVTKARTEAKLLIMNEKKEGKKEKPSATQAQGKEVKKEHAAATPTQGKEVQKESPSPKSTEKK